MFKRNTITAANLHVVKPLKLATKQNPSQKQQPDDHMRRAELFYN